MILQLQIQDRKYETADAALQLSAIAFELKKGRVDPDFVPIEPV